MFAYKKIFGATVLSLMSFPVFAAENCEPVPDCSAIGFAYTSAECGSLKKLKCPFDDRSYFCSKSECNQVTFNSTTQYCTKYCADTPSMCIEATYKTCDTTYNTGLFASNNGVGTLHAANGTFSYETKGKHYLLGPVTLSGIYFQGADIYSAGEQYPNNCERSMTGTPKLSGMVHLSGTNNFNVDVDFKPAFYDPSDSSKTYFYGNTDLAVEFESPFFNDSTTNFSVSFEGRDEVRTENTLCIYVDQGACNAGNCIGGVGNQLKVDIWLANADVKYGVFVPGSNYDIYCHGSNYSCEPDFDVCDRGYFH